MTGSGTDRARDPREAISGGSSSPASMRSSWSCACNRENLFPAKPPRRDGAQDQARCRRSRTSARWR